MLLKVQRILGGVKKFLRLKQMLGVELDPLPDHIKDNCTHVPEVGLVRRHGDL